MKLLNKKEYLELKGINERQYYRLKERGELELLHTLTGTFVIVRDEIRKMNDDAKNEIIEKLKPIWNMDIKTAHNLYSENNRATEKTTSIIKSIKREVEHYEELFGIKIKGYDIRSIQRKISSGKTERKTRSDKFKIRNRILNQEEVFEKSMELISNFYLKDPLGSLSNAIDRAIDYAQKNEEFWEVAAVNIHTLRRQINNAFKQSGFKSMNEYLNHFNIYRKKLGYAKGSFTNDIDFMEVWSLDDHKFDVSGALVFNEATGKMEQKMLYSWVLIELKTMMPMGWMIKTEPFKDDDIIRLMMGAFKKHGIPKKKVICDQGLAASERVKEFFVRLGIELDPQPPYSPTAKAPNERIFKIIKEECDIYNKNFVGSNHPVEGRHEGVKLSPEETTELVNEALKRYDNYLTGYFIERPRKREMQEQLQEQGLIDNTGRISIKDLFDYYYKSYEKIEISDINLRYAYLKYDAVKSFENYFMKFKNELYLPTSDLSLTLHDPSFRYIIAYDPDNMNTIDIYSAQDILDRLTGDLIAKGEYVGTLESLMMLEAGEKKKRVAVYNKKIKKSMLELTRNIRGKYSVDRNLINEVITESGELQNVRKEQEREIEKIITEALPIEKIESVLCNTGKSEDIDIQTALSEESYKSLDEL